MRAGQSCDVERTDEQLLDLFVSQGDTAAFEVLVRRPGPMVPSSAFLLGERTPRNHDCILGWLR